MKALAALVKGVLCSTLLAAAVPRAAAQPTERRPLFEAGVFGGGGWIPDYPAAGQNHWRGLALPYLLYRGEILRSDDRGVRGRFYRGDDLEFSLSFSGALRARSRDNRAREGMPDLDYLGEVGPALRWVAWRDGARRRITLELPVRAVFSTDFAQIDHRGFVLAPEAAFEHVGLFHPVARTRVGIGPVFATGGFMDYFYRVKDQYVRPNRPGYDAAGGYLGARLQFSHRRPVTDRVWLVGGGRVENFTGATNADSPLFRREWNVTLVGGVSISLYRSDAAVDSASEPFD
jgi:outer membrane scaffolding protein for murein synthesis (MipA/OmpV family)